MKVYIQISNAVNTRKPAEQSNYTIAFLLLLLLFGGRAVVFATIYACSVDFMTILNCLKGLGTAEHASFRVCDDLGGLVELGCVGIQLDRYRGR